MTSIRDMDAIENFVPTLIEQRQPQQHQQHGQDGYITAGPFSDGRSTVMSDGGYLDTVMHPMGRSAAAGGGGYSSALSMNGYLSTMPANQGGYTSPVNSGGGSAYSPGSLASGVPINMYPSGRPMMSPGAPQAPPDAGHLQLLLNMRDMCDTNMSTANDPKARVMARQARDGIDKQLMELRTSPTDGRASVASNHYHPPAGAVAGNGVPYVVPVSRSTQQQQQQRQRSVTPQHFIPGSNRM